MALQGFTQYGVPDTSGRWPTLNQTSFETSGSGPTAYAAQQAEAPYVSYFANQQDAQGQTPTQKALANIMGIQNTMASRQAMGPYAALSATLAGGQSPETLQAAERGIMADLSNQPAFIRDAVSGQQRSAERQLQDRYAAGEITDAQLRASRRKLADRIRQASIEASGKHRRGILGQAANVGLSQQRNAMQQAELIHRIFSGIQRAHVPTAQEQQRSVIGGFNRQVGRLV